MAVAALKIQENFNEVFDVEYFSLEEIKEELGPRSVACSVFLGLCEEAYSNHLLTGEFFAETTPSFLAERYGASIRSIFGTIKNLIRERLIIEEPLPKEKWSILNGHIVRKKIVLLKFPKDYLSNINFAQPTANFAQPTANFAQPTANFAQPTANFAQPTANFAQPTANFAQPTANFAQPTANFAQPTANFAQPTANFAQPTANFAQPTANFAQPTANFAQPTANFAQPTANFAQPEQYKKTTDVLLQAIELVKELPFLDEDFIEKIEEIEEKTRNFTGSANDDSPRARTRRYIYNINNINTEKKEKRKIYKKTKETKAKNSHSRLTSVKLVLPFNSPKLSVQEIPEHNQGVDSDTKKTRRAKKVSHTNSLLESYFQEWYNTYPYHKGRFEAFNAYKKASRSLTHDELLSFAKRYSESVSDWDEEQRKYIPLPSTWLNKKRWTDFEDAEKDQKPPVVKHNFLQEPKKWNYNDLPQTKVNLESYHPKIEAFLAEHRGIGDTQAFRDAKIVELPDKIQILAKYNFQRPQISHHHKTLETFLAKPIEITLQ